MANGIILLGGARSGFSHSPSELQVNSLLQPHKQLCQQKLTVQGANGDPSHSQCYTMLPAANWATKSYQTWLFSLPFVTLANLMKALCKQRSPNSISRQVKGTTSMNSALEHQWHFTKVACVNKQLRNRLVYVQTDSATRLLTKVISMQRTHKNSFWSRRKQQYQCNKKNQESRDRLNAAAFHRC